MKKTKTHAGTTLDADLAGYSATATATLAKKTSPGRTLKRVVGFGAATSAALLAGTSLEAAIVYSGLQNIVLAPGANGSSTTAIDMDGGGDDFILSQQNFTDTFRLYTTYGEPYTSTIFYGQQLVGASNGGDIATTGFGNAKNFSSGQLVGTLQSQLGPNEDFAWINGSSSFTTQNGDFPASQAGFLGVRLGSGNFGWIQIHRQFLNMTIIDWAYDDSGAHIMAGDKGVVPEPALLGLGLLSLGAAGVRELRRRKREAAEKVSEPTPTA